MSTTSKFFVFFGLCSVFTVIMFSLCVELGFFKMYGYGSGTVLAVSTLHLSLWLAKVYVPRLQATAYLRSAATALLIAGSVLLLLPPLPLVYTTPFWLLTITVFIYLSYTDTTELTLIDTSKKRASFWLSYTLLILTIAGIGLLLRLYHLDLLPPVTDEFFHLVAAKRLLFEGTFDYYRSAFVTYIISGNYLLAGNESLYVARLPGVMIGVASIFSTYFIARKLDRSAGISALWLIATLPLAVGMSRYVREYIYLYFVLTVFVGALISISFPTQLYSKQTLLLVMLYALPALYFLLVEDSNFVIQLYMYMGIISAVYWWQQKQVSLSRLQTIIVTTSIVFFIGALFSRVSWLIGLSPHTTLFLEPDLNYWRTLFDPSFSPWDTTQLWFTSSNLSVTAVVGFWSLGLYRFRRQPLFLAALVCFSITMITMVYFADRYYASRYIFYNVLFYIIIWSGAVSTLLQLRHSYTSWFSRRLYTGAVIVFCCILFSPLTTYRGLNAEAVGVTDPKKELLSYDYPTLFTTLSEVGYHNGDNLITSDGIAQAFMYYTDAYSFTTPATASPYSRIAYYERYGVRRSALDMSTVEPYFYDTSTIYSRPCQDQVCFMPENERITHVMDNLKDGWLVLDKDRNRNWTKQGFGTEDFYLGKNLVTHIKTTPGYRGFDIYHFTTTP